MRKYYLVLTPAAFLLIITRLVWASPIGASQEPPKNARGIAIPSDLKSVFQSSCMPCHSIGGKKMASALLDFSKWDKYRPGTQVKKGKEICKVITKNKMPPAPFTDANPELVLTQSQKDNICRWTESMKKRKD